MTPIWFVEYIAVSAGILVVIILIIEGLRRWKQKSTGIT